MVFKKINCKYNDRLAWCTNKNIKRSLFGLGSRVCIEHCNGKCELKETIGLAAPPPPPPKKNLQYESK